MLGLRSGSDRVGLAFANGGKVDAEFVIGADGVRSVIRRTLYGEDNPTYTGQMVWRALLNGRDVPPEVLEPTDISNGWAPAVIFWPITSAAISS